MLNLVNKLFVSASEKKIRSYKKLIEKINNFEENLVKLSDIELKNKTIYFKKL